MVAAQRQNAAPLHKPQAFNETQILNCSFISPLPHNKSLKRKADQCVGAAAILRRETF
jgi:hypothetical protein